MGCAISGGLDAITPFFENRQYGGGIWACGEGMSTAETNLVNEWVGFTVCLDIDESGTYMVGMAADNRTRFRVNGAPFFTWDSRLIEDFRRWWMNPVALSSGLNIIELDGKNDRAWAALGADFSGPFPAGSLATDTDTAAAPESRGLSRL